VCVCVCVCVCGWWICLHVCTVKRRMASAISTKLGTLILYGSYSESTDLRGHTATQTVTFTWLVVKCAAAAAGMELHVV